VSSCSPPTRLFGHVLERLARRSRSGCGPARPPSRLGRIFLAFSTGIRFPAPESRPIPTHVDDEHLDPFFAAVVEATEEATLDAIFTADTVTGQAGRTVPGLPIEPTLALLGAAGRPVLRS
jgi:D-aminopeptidase